MIDNWRNNSVSWNLNPVQPQYIQVLHAYRALYINYIFNATTIQFLYLGFYMIPFFFYSTTAILKILMILILIKCERELTFKWKRCRNTWRKHEFETTSRFLRTLSRDTVLYSRCAAFLEMTRFLGGNINIYTTVPPYRLAEVDGVIDRLNRVSKHDFVWHMS